jgi:hypothetical protein
MKTWISLTCAAAAALVTYATPTPAKACGGTFCDAGPQSMPVDQTGENILFVIEEGTVEAHIQIQYDGDPEQFAWIVPVMAMPEVTVGSDQLFQNLLAGTVPTFVLDSRTEGDCGGGGGGGGSGAGCGSFDLAAGGSFADSAQDFDDEEPDVVQRDVAGAYEYAVLDGGTVDGISAWLDDNGFARNDEAPAILQEYLDDGFMFIAFKLRAGAGVQEIQPVVVRYEGDEPCVPIRLTRIAAAEDMGIRAFFLGDHRVVPTNYRHVQVNPLRIDWLGLGANYEEVVTLAVDEEGSAGHGFVTEYAGSPSVVPRDNLLSALWDSSRFLDMEPRDLTELLVDEGLLECGITGCFPTHPMLGALLPAHYPPPDGVAAEVFYACTSCFAAELENVEWDNAGFAADFEERVIGPGEMAVDRLGRAYLTRMYTTISPAEMTADPLFHENADLPPVSNVWAATRVNVCEGPDRIELADGREIVFDEDDQPPNFDGMPYSMTAEEIPQAGGPIATSDNRDDIDGQLDDWNDAHSDDGNCACRAGRLSRHARGAGWLGFMVLLGLRARRRRR